MFTPDPDHRDFPRMTFDAEVHWRETGGEEWQVARMINLSATGILIQAGRCPAADARVEVHVPSAGDAVPPLRGIAEVVRCERAAGGFEIAFSFLEMA